MMLYLGEDQRDPQEGGRKANARAQLRANEIERRPKAAAIPQIARQLQRNVMPRSQARGDGCYHRIAGRSLAYACLRPYH